MRFQGKISEWNDDKGYGFVEPNGGGERTFIHIKSFKSRARRPANGDLVIYEVEKDSRQRSNAVNVSFPHERSLQRKRGGSNVSLIWPLLFISSIFALTLFQRIPALILIVYISLSIITFIAYAIDKHAAQNNHWRTQESTLHLLALLGGWPGALSVQQLLRHKSAKVEFRQVFCATVFMNLLLLCGLTMSDPGRAMLGTVTTELLHLIAPWA
ncbi:cold shock and DUF1294 domain-containing protein [Aeromonas allosaccharophila]|uniref:cold shock and DUF1294 domain-containing protein n=1 Tax=Aeromonas allosaccharophila TaxID=656 RepID=UPI002B45C7BE|nr:cold shock and DUF1294 domain-containing protein [Aeromonas allosaccharophila]